ncbi:MAG: ATP-binding cassette domain-containing protein [Actinomycetota bacterium]|nr:ATP-binding cassette domain-containing protein [Actinomycetota bacterium]
MVFGRRHQSGEAGAVLSVQDHARGSLEVGPDQTVVLLGASGSGKTTWLRSLVGVGSGFDQTLLFGKPVTKAGVAASIGWVPQTDGVFLSETVWSNVHAPKYVEPCPPDQALDALDWVGLADRAMEPVVNLGSGARRRVALARAVARRRPLLVIDGELDRSLWPMFPALCQQFSWLRGVVVATATVEDLAWNADHVAPVADGRVLDQAPLATLMASNNPDVKGVLAWTTP